MAYAYAECGMICLGILFLLGGSLSDLTMPLFVGKVVDHLQKGTDEDFRKISELCLYMIIVVSVS